MMKVGDIASKAGTIVEHGAVLALEHPEVLQGLIAILQTFLKAGAVATK